MNELNRFLITLRTAVNLGTIYYSERLDTTPKVIFEVFGHVLREIESGAAFTQG